MIFLGGRRGGVGELLSILREEEERRKTKGNLGPDILN